MVEFDLMKLKMVVKSQSYWNFFTGGYKVEAYTKLFVEV